jgi:Domain of Unknown Function (DUF349)
MKLFSRFFRKAAPSPPTLEERVATLGLGSADLILGTALGTDEEGLRVAAIRKLPDGDALRKFAGLSGGGAHSGMTQSGVAHSSADKSAGAAVPIALVRAAQARMAQLLDEGSIDFAGFREQVGNRPAMFSVAALCQDTSRLAQALASIDDPKQIAQLVLDSPSSRLRQLAAEAVEDPAQIRQLLKRVRTKDKSVYKILKLKCDVLNAEERKAAEIQSEINVLCASLERHSNRTYDALYTSAFEQLETRWRSLTTRPAQDTEQRAQQAIDRCREVIAAHLRQVALEAAQRAAEHAARDARVRADQSTQEAASAEADTEALRRNEAAAVREAEQKARAEKWAAEDLVLRQVGGLIRKANGALSDGHTQRAAELRRAIEEKLPKVPAMPTYLSRHLQQLDDKLNELKQWKDYAVAPKRLELIDEMEALIGSSEEPKVLADRIKTLQQEWRTISKGIVSDAPAEWERFQQAATAAYQPCREYFEAQAKLRQDNLENRKAVLERLAAFEAAQNAGNPDWRLLASVLREAPQEWRRYFPVDREASRAIQEDFDASMGRLTLKLDAWYERNVADKQSLIKRARQLLTQEDSRRAIDAVKQLQILWKETGVAPRDQDQSLWSEFRELCDAVYQKRQQAYAEYTAGLEASKLNAVALCEEAERVAALSGTALLEGGAKIPDWRTAFDALDEMPRAEARGLQDRFERALDLCQAQMAEQHLRDAEQSYTNLFEAGRRLSAYEWSVARHAETSDQEALKQAIETFIASVQLWPKGGLQTVKERLAKVGSLPYSDNRAGSDDKAGSDNRVSADSEIDVKDEVDVNDEARERALRTLCVRCEIQSETPTPPEDEALRREYQVTRLMRGMGQGNGADEGSWDAMMLEWIRIGAISPTVHENLQGRFMRCWAKRPVRRPQRSAFQPDGSGSRQGHESRVGQMRRDGRDGRDGSKIATAR